jgi:large subunit ribosomal protein L21
LTFPFVFNIIFTFRLAVKFPSGERGDNNKMSYAIIRTGGKQFAVAEGQTLRVPSIDKKEGERLDIEALVSGEGAGATLGGATVSATVIGHGRGDKIIVFKKKRRKQYKRTQGHRQNYTEIKIEKI